MRERACARPDAAAVIEPGAEFTWQDYDEAAESVASALSSIDLTRGDRVAVLLPDGFAVHAALVGCARAGVVAVGLGSRSGDAEVEHLVRVTGARVLLAHPEHRGRATYDRIEMLRSAGLLDVTPLLVDERGRPVSRVESNGHRRHRALAAHEVSMLNSTSGTTGLPKCVTQFDHRWLHFADVAAQAGSLTDEDVILAVVPTPFGFGLWTSHFAGPVLGVGTVVMPRFDAAEMLQLIERHQVTVVCCVTTQLRMMLNCPGLDTTDLSSLRIVFTGGEPVPRDRASMFERVTGASVLQFYGSNETGALSCTRVGDGEETRWDTAGEALEHMDVRLFDRETGAPVDGGTGQPGCRGPLTSVGYWDDPRANRELFTADGWMLTGDVVTIDRQGRLRVSGRSSDFIIRGGKNISAVEVESLVETHPAVALVSVVPVPDETYGERVCAVVVLQPDTGLTLDELVSHCLGSGASREWLPERLVIVPDLPRNSGGKIAKGEVRSLVNTP